MSQKVNNPDNTIAFQGIPGAYSEMACLSNFNTMETLACPSFEQMISSVQDNKAKLAMVPVENSTAGRVADIHHLLPESGLFIIGETFFRVNHMLLGPKGSKLENLKEVRSHAQGLAQCRQNINNLNLIPVIHPDTAGAAKEVSELNDKFIGAIASNLAAKRYNLEILNESIQTIKNNKTRFVILEKKKTNDEFNKAALKFILDHKRGSLASVLNMMSDCSLNLTKIQSLPVIQTPGKYAFFVDITFNSVDNYNKAKKIIEIMAQEFKVLGEYKIKEL